MITAQFTPILIEDTATQAIAELQAADPLLAEVIARWPTCPLRYSPNYFSDLASAVVAQQISTKAAQTIWNRLLALCDGSLSPELLARLSPEELRTVGISGQKAGYLHALGVYFTQHKEKASQLHLLPDEAVIKELVSIKGIGVWTAQMFLMFSLNRTDVLPVADLGLKKGLQRLHNLPEMPTVAEMEGLTNSWRPWRSIATWYIWRSLENAPAKVTGDDAGAA